MLNFGASKPRVRGGARAPGAPPLDPRLHPNVPQDFHIGKSLLNSAWSLFLAAATSEIEVDGLLKAHYSLVEFHYVILFP